jgi:hypothetical protein
MTTDVKTRTAITSSTLSVPHLRPARFDDYDNISRLLEANSLEIHPIDDWRRLWLDNPLWPRIGKDSSIGWLLETVEGEIVGFLETVPSLYRFRGDELISAVASAWVVRSEYRGFALHLIDEYFNQPHVDLFINTTVGPMAIESFQQLSAPIPLGEWDSAAFWVTGYRGFAKKTLQKRGVPLVNLLAPAAGAALWLKDAVCSTPLRKTAGSFVIETTDRFDSRFDVFWDELLRQHPDKLLAERSRHALSWHFASAMRSGRLWIFTASQNRQLRAYCTLIQQDHVFAPVAQSRRNAAYLRGMLLVDFQSVEEDTDPLPGLLAAALRRCAAEDIHVLENHGRGVPKMRALDECVPYRRKLANWNFFYRAADADLDAELREPRLWDPSAFDGDASL